MISLLKDLRRLEWRLKNIWLIKLTHFSTLSNKANKNERVKALHQINNKSSIHYYKYCMHWSAKQKGVEEDFPMKPKQENRERNLIRTQSRPNLTLKYLLTSFARSNISLKTVYQNKLKFYREKLHTWNYILINF